MMKKWKKCGRHPMAFFHRPADGTMLAKKPGVTNARSPLTDAVEKFLRQRNGGLLDGGYRRRRGSGWRKVSARRSV